MLDPVPDFFRGVVSERRDRAELCRFVYRTNKKATKDEHCINQGPMVEP